MSYRMYPCEKKYEKNEAVGKMKIIVDTREQSPFLFRGYDCQIEPGTLHTGDYSLAGMVEKIVLERKTIGDLASCMTSGRARFEREMERMRDFESAAVIVEGPLAEIRGGKYRCGLNPDSFEQSILSLMIRYRVPFLFGWHRRHAEWLAFNCLRHFWNHRAEYGSRVAFSPFRP